MPGPPRRLVRGKRPLGHPDIVVLTERGYDEPGNPFSVPAKGGEVPASSKAGQQVFINTTRAGIRSLEAPGRKIVLLRPCRCLPTWASSR